MSDLDCASTIELYESPRLLVAVRSCDDGAGDGVASTLSEYDVEAISVLLARDIEEQIFATICGPSIKQHQTALRYRFGRFESVHIDPNTNQVIEPPARCPRCGPVIACSRHWVTT